MLLILVVIVCMLLSDCMLFLSMIVCLLSFVFICLNMVLLCFVIVMCVFFEMNSFVVVRLMLLVLFVINVDLFLSCIFCFFLCWDWLGWICDVLLCLCVDFGLFVYVKYGMGCIWFKGCIIFEKCYLIWMYCVFVVLYV